jgi:hypothetical protein
LGMVTVRESEVTIVWKIRSNKLNTTDEVC